MIILSFSFTHQLLLKLMAQQSQRRCQILISDHNIFRNPQLYCGKIPDCPDTTRYQLVTDNLRLLLWNGNDADFYIQTPAKIGNLPGGKQGFSVERQSIQRLVVVKCSQNMNAALIKAVLAQQCFAQRAYTH